MSAAQIGDQVRASLVGNVVAKLHNGDTVVVRDADGYEYTAPASSCTALPKPLKVGDVVQSAGQIAELPDGSVIACQAESALPAAKRAGHWYVGVNDVIETKLLAAWPNAVVLRVGASL